MRGFRKVYELVPTLRLSVLQLPTLYGDLVSRLHEYSQQT